MSADDVAGTIANLVPLVTSETPAIEEYVELRVPGVPIPVIGYVDVIEQDGVPCDLKTSSRAWSANKAQDELQPIFYLAALNQAGYDLNPDFKFRHYVFTKAKKPQVQVWETTRTFSDLFWLFGLIADVWHGIEREVFPPSPVTWRCGEKYCEYWSICRGKVL